MQILFDQVGFCEKAPIHIALLRQNELGLTDWPSTLQIVDAFGQWVQSYVVPAPTLHTSSGMLVSLVACGNLPAQDYTIQVADLACQSFRVRQRPYTELALALAKSYYYQRASIELLPTFAGPWARAAGHADDMVYIHPSAQGPVRVAGDVISAPKGWYDAGDYNKYVVNSAITTWTLLALEDHFPGIAQSRPFSLPESGAALPDLLAEVRWNLDWMLCMQDPADGGVYHKLTNLLFDPMQLPALCNSPRYVVVKTTAATLDFCAAMAQASRLYKAYDITFAETCLDAAQRAFTWCESNPQVFYVQPSDVRTGQYTDTHLEDEWYWARCELHLACGYGVPSLPKTVFDGKDFTGSVHKGFAVPNWSEVGLLGVISLAMHAEGECREQARLYLMKLADNLLAKQSFEGLLVAMEPSEYLWGSNGVVANQGMVLVVAYLLSSRKDYLHAARNQLHWLLGRNPLCKCFVTGFGENSPRYPHHRPSAGDGVDDPVPGLLVGGPNPDCQDSAVCPPYPSRLPALAYQDHTSSCASNEVAINWNAPMVYLTWALDYL